MLNFVERLNLKRCAFFVLCIACVLLFWTCQNKGDADLPEPLSDKQISSNLSKKGKIDPELLIGEWDAVAFAYTADGKRITNKVAVPSRSAWVDAKQVTIPGGRLTIPSTQAYIDDCGTDIWELGVLNTIWFSCSISDNLIDLTCCLGTYMLVAPPHAEYDLYNALANAYSFVINGNELFIYFKKIEDKDVLSTCKVIKNKNLLILKKR